MKHFLSSALCLWITMCHYEGKELCDGGEKKIQNWKGAENVAEEFTCKQTVKGTDTASNWINSIEGKPRSPPKK